MSNDEFEALLALIKAVFYYQAEARAHPNDQPRNVRGFSELEEAIEEAREALVL